MDMKARGLFVSRALSFEGCGFEIHRCNLSAAERAVYDAAADFWLRMLEVIEKCTRLTSDHGGSTPRYFWGAHQAFFKQLLNSLKVRFAIAQTQKALDEGQSVVVGLISTGEAKVAEAIERERQSTGGDLTEEVSTPQEIARKMLSDHIPVMRAGSFVQEAVKMKRELENELDTMELPNNALDMFIGHFGIDAVAEMTGRKLHFDPIERHFKARTVAGTPGADTAAVNLAEMQAFLSGRKRIAVISDAASSGISLHADQRFPNREPRLHLTLELSWSADKALQQFGRTHRSNQTSAPHYMVLVTDVGGENRFASTIARRISTLGAITRGERRAGHGGYEKMAELNVDTPMGKSALGLMMEAVQEKAENERVWEKMLRSTHSYKDANREVVEELPDGTQLGVPTLIGLSVVRVARGLLEGDIPQRETSTRSSARRPQLGDYVRKVYSNGARYGATGGSQLAHNAQYPSRDRQKYGACPKRPSGALSWHGAADALINMRLIERKQVGRPDGSSTHVLGFVKDSDRNDINKFLNRLLGLRVKTQEELFQFYHAVYGWVKAAARSQGKDDAVGIIGGESIESVSMEIVHTDVRSSAPTFQHTLRVDRGMKWATATAQLDSAVAEGARSLTGFWQQKTSKRIVLLTEWLNGAVAPSKKVYRKLGPTLHHKQPAQYIRHPEVLKKYNRLGGVSDAVRSLWEKEHTQLESQRMKEYSLITGALLPIWPAIGQVRQKLRQGGDKPLDVRRCMVRLPGSDKEQSVIGVYFRDDTLEMLKERLAKMKADEEKEYAAEGPQFNSPGYVPRPPNTAPARAPVVRRPQIDGAPDQRRQSAPGHLTLTAGDAGGSSDGGAAPAVKEEESTEAKLSRLPDDDDDSDGEDGGLNFS